MSQPVLTLTFLSFMIGSTYGSLNPKENQQTLTRLLRNKDNQCPPWTYYSASIEQCKCYSDVRIDSNYRVRCNGDKTSIINGYCMTYDNKSSTVSLSYCPYFKLQGHNISQSEPGMIDLPDNISQLNDYMCDPMNREGVLCSQCIDGYGPSATSRKFQCSPCSGVWYGVPLYLFIELVPVTVFYIIVLFFQLNLTTAPMIGFIFYSNYISLLLITNLVVSNGNQTYSKVIDFLYGIWTLDFFRYVIPPFCISSKLKLIHIFYLQCLSTIFPYILIAITWILINLHSRDCKVVVWMWKKLDGIILKHLNVKRNSKITVVDTFAAFFLLTFVKMYSLLVAPLGPLPMFQVNNFNYSTNHTINSYISDDYGSVENVFALVATLGIYVFVVLSPTVVIALYPYRLFRKLLLKYCCRRFIYTLNFFTEKFYSCYRDGLDGGKDMRSFASLHFFIAILLFIVFWTTFSSIALASILGGYSLLIAIVQPYKKRHMVVIESLILANMAFVLALSANALNSYQIVSQISATLPAFGLIILICYRFLKISFPKCYTKIIEKMSKSRQFVNDCLKKHNQQENSQEVDNDEAEIQLPDRVVHPEDYETNYTAY